MQYISVLYRLDENFASTCFSLVVGWSSTSLTNETLMMRNSHKQLYQIYEIHAVSYSNVHNFGPYELSVFEETPLVR